MSARCGASLTNSTERKTAAKKKKWLKQRIECVYGDSVFFGVLFTTFRVVDAIDRGRVENAVALWHSKERKLAHE